MKPSRLFVFRFSVLVIVLTGSLCCLVGGSTGEAAENNTYRAGYVMGYTDAPAWKAKDPNVTAGQYATRKRDLLKRQGPVPRVFWRGLRDGFRDAVRAYRPKFTIDRVNPDVLPVYLRPQVTPEESPSND